MLSALVIDDNFHNRNIFRIALEQVGYYVTESINGIDGLERINHSDYSLVVLDLHMPMMDGKDVLRTLRGAARWQNLQVIVVTANPHMATDEIHTLVDYVLQKPVDIESFCKLVKRLTTNHA